MIVRFHFLEYPTEEYSMDQSPRVGEQVQFTAPVPWRGRYSVTAVTWVIDERGTKTALVTLVETT